MSENSNRNAPEIAAGASQRRPIVALLTDFGTADGYVGVMKGVIAGIAPNAHLIDLTHEIAPQDVAGGAWVLSTAWRSFPAATIFLCVVDPGVGTERMALAVACGGYTFVAPDNGLLSYVLDASPEHRAVRLDRPRYHRANPSATFHGRDVFAPCAAWLAAGTPLAEVGTEVVASSLVRLPPLRVEEVEDTIVASIVHIDHYGNLITSIGPELTNRVLASPSPRVSISGTVLTTVASTFAAGPTDTPFLLRDSSGHLAIAVRNGSAAAALAVRCGDAVTVEGVRGASGAAR